MSNERTYQTRIAPTAEQEVLLAAYVELYCKVERKLFAAGRAGANFDKLKTDYIKKYKITARQFNAISRNLKGKIASITELRDLNIKNLEGRIKTAKKKISKMRNLAKKHQKKRRLAILSQKLAAQQKNKSENKINLCFGSKKLFGKQFNLAENDYANHAEWRAAWQKARSAQFCIIGSKDETAGCQGCVATIEFDGSLTLRLRLPDAMVDNQNKYAVIDDVRFPYGQEHIVAALAAKQSLSYRFVRDDKGWRVLVTTDMPYIEQTSRQRLGAFGIDINADCLAVSEVDHYGNLVASKVIPCVTYGKSSDQAMAIIGDAIKEVILMAKAAGKPIVIEKLDFTKKKAELEADNARHSRMLSSFSYSAVKQIITARAYDAGVEVITVNPAYTSTIGQINFAERFGISVHQGAALAIARRGLGFNEKPATDGAKLLPDGVHGTFALPVRNRAKHVWTQWAGIRRNLRAALAAHKRLSKRSLTPSGQLIRPPMGATCLFPVRFRDASQQHCSAGEGEMDVPMSVETTFPAGLEHLSTF